MISSRASPARSWRCSARTRARAGAKRSWSRDGGPSPVSGFRSLSQFLDHLGRAGDLKRVRREVDWAYEVTEIACREAKAEGPALLFENVRGAKFPLAVNVLAARRRIEWAIGRTPRSVGAELEEILHAVPPRAFGDLVALRGSAG